MHDFFAMGGYAAYVWPAYGITTTVLLATALWPTFRRRRLQAELRKRWQWEQGTDSRISDRPTGLEKQV